MPYLPTRDPPPFLTDSSVRKQAPWCSARPRRTGMGSLRQRSSTPARPAAPEASVPPTSARFVPTRRQPALTGPAATGEHQFEMAGTSSNPQVVHRTARICLRTTPAQANRCYRLLRAAGDVWAWLLDDNRNLRPQGDPAVVSYQALCRQLTSSGGFGGVAVV